MSESIAEGFFSAAEPLTLERRQPIKTSDMAGCPSHTHRYISMKSKWVFVRLRANEGELSRL